MGGFFPNNQLKLYLHAAPDKNKANLELLKLSKKTAHHPSQRGGMLAPYGRSGRFSDPAFSIEINFAGSPPVNTPVEKADFKKELGLRVEIKSGLKSGEKVLRIL